MWGGNDQRVQLSRPRWQYPIDVGFLRKLILESRGSSTSCKHPSKEDGEIENFLDTFDEDSSEDQRYPRKKKVNQNHGRCSHLTYTAVGSAKYGQLIAR